MKFHEGVGVTVALAGADDGTLQTPAVLRIDHDDDVAASNGLGDQIRQRHPFAGLGRADEESPPLEVLQWAVQCAFAGLHAMDVWQADLCIRLWRDLVPEKIEQGGRDRVLAVIDLGKLVQALRVLGQPVEAEAQKDLCRILGQPLLLNGADDLHRPSSECCAQYHDVRSLGGPPDRHGQAGECHWYGSLHRHMRER